MNPTRNGKIARLPWEIRETLNGRLAENEPGKQLVEWLNGLAPVQETLVSLFAGRPISEQNLSEWRQGGYQDWLRHQEALDAVARLAEEAQEIDEASNGRAVSDRVGSLLAVELARTAEALLKQDAAPRERWQILRELLPALASVRREDHRAARLRMEEERWGKEREAREAEEERDLRETENRKLSARIWGRLYARELAPIFGGGEKGLQLAATVTELKHDLELGTLFGPNEPGHTGTESTPSAKAQPAPDQPDHTESSPIKPDPGDLGRKATSLPASSVGPGNP